MPSSSPCSAKRYCSILYNPVDLSNRQAGHPRGFSRRKFRGVHTGIIIPHAGSNLHILRIKRRGGAKRSDLPHTIPFPWLCTSREFHRSSEPSFRPFCPLKSGIFLDELASLCPPHSRLNPQRMTGLPVAAPKNAPPGFRRNPPPRTTKRKRTSSTQARKFSAFVANLHSFLKGAPIVQLF